MPHVVAVTTAEVTDRRVLARWKPCLGQVQSPLADGGYVRLPFV